MKPTDKNVIMITAGGIGHRFGADMPKQYLLLDGKPIIEYVVETCKKSVFADSVVVIADPSYHEEIKDRYKVDVAVSGSELNITKRNGFDYVKANSACEKLVVVEAVRPTLTVDVIDKTFHMLDSYDAVACARKITDSLGHYGEWVVNREDYYTLNPPEGFRFGLIDRYFDPVSQYTESIQQLPEASRVYLNFDAPYFEKITYPEDLAKVEAYLKSKKA